MKTLLLIPFTLVAAMCLATAEEKKSDKTLGEKTAETLEKAKEKTKDAGREILLSMRAARRSRGADFGDALVAHVAVLLCPVFQLGASVGARAVDAAENLAFFLDAVADDLTAAARAAWRERMDRTFEAVKGVRLSADDHLKRFVVIVPADFTSSHIGCRVRS